MQAVLVDFFGWYVVIQIVGLAALPLTWRIFAGLADGGYAFSKVLGTLLVGLILWLGTSYGLLRNEAGGAWLSLLILAGISVAAGWPLLSRGPVRLGNLRGFLPAWSTVSVVEALFLAAFLAWTWVRAHDPAINHTEQPMDLMFMNGIWTSATFPPRDPWLAGYAISYYYFGYWLLMTLAQLAGQPPEIAYNLGQACWFGLLLVSCYGLGYNLMALSRAAHRSPNHPAAQSPSPRAIAAGLLTAATVGLAGNLQVILEWLHAQGVNVSGLAAWAQVRNFPDAAPVTNQWFIDANWSWWWRASRVISDRDLLGNHIEVIDEFPIFSYVLGDNHPHVLAMPIAVLVIALALRWWQGLGNGDWGLGTRDWGLGIGSVAGRVAGQFQRIETSGAESGNQGLASVAGRVAGQFQRIETSEADNSSRTTHHAPRPQSPAHPITHLPLPLLLVTLLATGSLVFLNTWDFPPYLLLLTVIAGVAGLWYRGWSWAVVGVWGSVTLLLLGTLTVYFPYLLTAQSQAGGIVPNFFNPTRLPQFLMMFGHFLLGIGGLALLAWGERRTSLTVWGISVGLTLGLPILFLLAAFALASNIGIGQAELRRMVLPPEFGSYGEAILARWTTQGWTFLLLGLVTATALALLWPRLVGKGDDHRKLDPATTFALLLAGIGLLLIYAPEFVFLRDNFGNRMNTVFKFYYQGWLLLGAATSYAIVRSLPTRPNPQSPISNIQSPIPHIPLLLTLPALLLIGGGLIYAFAGPAAKTQAFGVREPTLNGMAYVGQDELAAVEWIRRHVPPEAVLLQGKGRSYLATDNRLNTATGRATLLGWDGHQSQWRGNAYGRMAEGRPEAIETIYRSGSAQDVAQTLRQRRIDFVLIGPVERDLYSITPDREETLAQSLDLVFEQGSFRIYQRRLLHTP